MGFTVFITGAGRGLGLSLAHVFLRNGYRVFAGRRGESERLATLAGADAEKLCIVPIDVTDMISINRAVAEVAAQTSALDLLINNAAVCLDGGVRLEDLDFGVIAKILDVNAFGPLRVTQKFLPLLKAGSLKRIVNISSEAGSIGDCWRKGMFGYCMSKAALNMQSKILSNYLKLNGFSVLVLHPGWMKTDMGGPNADIAPEEAAEGIFAVVTGRQTGRSSMYMTYKGKKLRW